MSTLENYDGDDENNKVDKPIRFSRLFPVDPRNLPKIWPAIKTQKLNKIPAITQRNPYECQPDDMEKFMAEKCIPFDKNPGISANDLPKVCEWRHGPAELWYDMIDVPESGEGFDYGFKLKDSEQEEEKNENGDEVHEDCYQVPEDCYLMVNQLSWEDDIIWDAADIREEVMATLNEKNNNTGWPVSTSTGILQPTNSKDDTCYSMFPVENQDLVHGSWEDDIIWDAEAMNQIPSPKIFTLDPNDENVCLGHLNDTDPNTRSKSPDRPVKEQKNASRKSQILVGKAKEEERESEPAETVVKSMYNISNDEYYNPKMTHDDALHTMGVKMIQHSTPAVELRAPFFPTHMSVAKLRDFHRPLIKRYSHGDMALPGPHKVFPLRNQIKTKAKLREQERQACGGGDMFFMRTAEDLTGCDGQLILAEYCEQHPPLVMQVGMATKIKNYYKRKPGKDQCAPEYVYGETAFAHTAPFLGSLAPGQSLQAFENNLFRAPIYEHPMSETDFLVVRTRQHYFIRKFDSAFTVGQLCPLFEVPAPTSRTASEFARCFVQVYIYRLFWKSVDVPLRIKMDDVRKAFPAHSENWIRKQLKVCAEFKRTGLASGWWVIKPTFRLPTEDEIREMVTPEECCAYYSMAAAQQRLKDAGYGEKTMFSLDNDDNDDEELQVKMEDEVNAAPWNTTRAFINAMQNKCMLQLRGVADPTGCGEGFSYVRLPNKPTKEETDAKHASKKVVTGTDADLRKLSLNNAKSLLKKYGISDDEIKTLSRWEVIDAVRTLSTQQAKDGGVALSKFARGNRFSLAEQQEKYKKECQQLFDLQNRILDSDETLLTDHGPNTSDDDSELEMFGKNLEDLITDRTTDAQLAHELEEIERLKLQKLMLDPKPKPPDAKPQNNRCLRIYRTFRSPDGQEYVRTETILNPAVIDTYLRVRTTKDPSFIKQFSLDEHQREEMRREKRRIQEQLRRLRRNEACEPPPAKRARKEKPELKLRCGACGVVGHMRTNQSCPAYNGSGQSLSPSVNVEGIKLVVSKGLGMRADELRRKSFKRKRTGTTDDESQSSHREEDAFIDESGSNVLIDDLEISDNSDDDDTDDDAMAVDEVGDTSMGDSSIGDVVDNLLSESDET